MLVTNPHDKNDIILIGMITMALITKTTPLALEITVKALCLRYFWKVIVVINWHEKTTSSKSKLLQSK